MLHLLGTKQHRELPQFDGIYDYMCM